MRFMNDTDIEQAAARWAGHPVLGPATRTLAGLEAWADANSDGWATWAAPVNAARRLIDLILRDGTTRYVFDDERADATTGELRTAYTPLRRFRTRYEADFELVDPAGDAAPAAVPADADARRASSPQPPEETSAASPGPARRRRPAPENIHDYNRLIRGQRTRLAAAIDSGDPAQVLATCRDAVTAWNLPGNGWPPDAERWQAALDQLTPGGTAGDTPLLLEDLAAEPVPDDPGDADDEPAALFDVGALTSNSQDRVVPAQSAGPAPITNADVAAALQHIAGSSTGGARSVAEFITHGTVPGPGSATGPGDSPDITAWNSSGLRRTVLRGQPGRDGSLTWGQAAQWIHAGMTSGDLKILLNAGQLAAFCDGWLEHLRGTAYPEGAGQGGALRDAGRGAAAILQDCITRVTDAAAQAHGPGAPVPAAPPGSTTYRHEQVAAAAGQAQILAAISELGGAARQAGRKITGSTEPPAEDGAPAGRAGRLTSKDLAIVLKHLRPGELLSSITGTPPVYHGWHTSRRAGDPEAGASEDVTGTATGLQIIITAPAATRAGTVTWKQVAAWLAPALTPARRRLLEEADRVHLQYLIHRNENCIGGTSEQQTVAGAEQELSALCSSAVAAVVDAALAAHGPGPLRRLTVAGPAASDDDALFAGAEQLGGEDTGLALQRIAQLASVLPPWPARWRKPLSQVQPGDVLKHDGNLGDPFTVTEEIRRKGDVTEIDGTLQKRRPGITTTWVYAHKDTPDPQVDFYPPGGPLTGPVPAAPGAQPAVSETAEATGPDAAATAPAGTQKAARPPAGSEAAAAGSGQRRTGYGETDGTTARAEPPSAAAAGSSGAGPAAPSAGCTICGETMDPVLAALGYATHPCCAPDDKPLDDITADANARQIIDLAARQGLQPRLDTGDAADGADGTVSILIGVSKNLSKLLSITLGKRDSHGSAHFFVCVCFSIETKVYKKVEQKFQFFYSN